MNSRHDIADWDEIGMVLQSLAEPVEPPEGFAAGVMRRLEPPPQRLWDRIYRKGNRSIAVAAAVVALVGAAIPLATRIPPQAPMVADGTAVGDGAHVENSALSTMPVQPDGLHSQEASVSTKLLPPPAEPVNPVNSTENRTSSPSGKGSVSGVHPEPQPLSPGRVKTAQSESHAVFLSKARVITSHIVKIAVDDIDAARSSLASLASQSGSNVSNISAQDEKGQPVVVLRFTASGDASSSVLNQVGALGTIISSKVETQDISARFDSTLEQQRQLMAQRDSVTDGEKKSQLDQQIASIQDQLTKWDEEANRHVFMVWLQTKEVR
ncbi:DUF4349 domain-containing protein [Heliobacillus mobilis]|uniref:DUF4349 domain-containing protein n=1 Tax=Heliobacterium mobile TaxID=28064 RepID=A0A6I3SL24_HELMO|nr:DUF4349 domain-containing protein [Heliobacterium mobile]MTV49603.1 DUF4349 domain-containing protein [Heliobacterium mobile]